MITRFHKFKEELTPEKLIAIEDTEYDCSSCPARSICDAHQELTCDESRVLFWNEETEK